MSKSLKTLFQHNSEMSATYMAASNACLNGIECPMCGNEMWKDPAWFVPAAYSPSIEPTTQANPLQ